jgi:hypothetical protein
VVNHALHSTTAATIVGQSDRDNDFRHPHDCGVRTRSGLRPFAMYSEPAFACRFGSVQLLV